jgi:hypothetical protein
MPASAIVLVGRVRGRARRPLLCIVHSVDAAQPIFAGSLPVRVRSPDVRIARYYDDTGETATTRPTLPHRLEALPVTFTFSTLLAAEITLRRVLVFIGLIIAVVIFTSRRLRRKRRKSLQRTVKAAYDADPAGAARRYGHATFAAWLDARFDEEMRAR